jgi:hypothetical protein
MAGALALEPRTTHEQGNHVPSGKRHDRTSVTRAHLPALAEMQVQGVSTRRRSGTTAPILQNPADATWVLTLVLRPSSVGLLNPAPVRSAFEVPSRQPNPCFSNPGDRFMHRRRFIQTSLQGMAATMLGASWLDAVAAPLPKMKITRVRFYESPFSRPMFNQSFHIVTVETDAGITGIGEGGSRDTIQECAEMLIGEDPTRIDHCWQAPIRSKFPTCPSTSITRTASCGRMSVRVSA